MGVRGVGRCILWLVSIGGIQHGIPTKKKDLCMPPLGLMSGGVYGWCM